MTVSEIPTPAFANESRTPSVITQRLRTVFGAIGVTKSLCAGVSTMSATAPESLKIHSTCSADDVS